MRLGLGLGLEYSKLSGGSSSFDPDYQAVLDFATSEGDTLPSASQQILQNNVVLSLKDKGLWNKKDAFGLFATDGNVDFALICWKRLIKMNAISSPSFSANAGVTGNGTSSYIDTLFVPSTNGVNFLQDDAGVSINCTGGVESYVIGTSSTANGNVRIRKKNYSDSQINGDIINANLDMSPDGNLHMDRNSATQVSFKNGNNVVTTSNNSTGLTTNPIWLLRVTSIESNATVKAFTARASFTDTEKNDYDTIINTYLDAI
jgi:hypothetical protein